MLPDLDGSGPGLGDFPITFVPSPQGPVIQSAGPPGISNFDNSFAGSEDPVTVVGFHLAEAMGMGGGVDVGYYKHGSDRGIFVSPVVLAGIESAVSL